MESERVTRKQRIDAKLKAAGWNVVRLDMSDLAAAASAIEEYETSLGPADYVLADNSDLLGVVEAKKLTVGAQGILPQSERYARAIPSLKPWQGEFGVPFLYSTNGEEIWFHDVRSPDNRSRKVATFHTSGALREMLERDFDAEFDRLRTVPLNPGLRPYQVEANTAIEQAIAERKRQMLVAMATGTGKTLHDGQPDLPPDEVRPGSPRPVPRRPPRPCRPGGAGVRHLRGRAGPQVRQDLRGLSQRFQQTDFGEDEKFDPKVLPNSLSDRTRSRATPSSTSARSSG